MVGFSRFAGRTVVGSNSSHELAALPPLTVAVAEQPVTGVLVAQLAAQVPSGVVQLVGGKLASLNSSLEKVYGVSAPAGFEVGVSSTVTAVATIAKPASTRSAVSTGLRPRCDDGGCIRH